MFDYRLGYVREGCKMLGFDVIGSGAKRIVALGGYSTPEMARNGQTWAHALNRQLGEDSQIINGCTDGYSSAQILTMFIREVLLFEPETVVCLSGFYDIAYRLGFTENKADADFLRVHPFTTPGQLHFLRGITSGLGLGREQVFYGEENHLSASGLWLLHIADMHCLCEEFGIEFKAFLQPCVFSGGYNLSEREHAYLREYYGLSNEEIESFCSGFKSEYASIAKKAQDLDYVIDLSAVLDGCEDAYIDACHVKHEFVHRITEKML